MIPALSWHPMETKQKMVILELSHPIPLLGFGERKPMRATYQNNNKNMFHFKEYFWNQITKPGFLAALHALWQLPDACSLCIALLLGPLPQVCLPEFANERWNGVCSCFPLSNAPRHGYTWELVTIKPPSPKEGTKIKKFFFTLT